VIISVTSVILSTKIGARLREYREATTLGEE